MSRVAAIILAAGTSSRMGEGAHKLLQAYRGRPLVAHAVAAATASAAWPVVLVTGCRADEIAAAAGAVDLVAHNPHYADGVAGSIGAGLKALLAEAEAALIVLGDMPLVRSTTLDAMIAAFGAARPDAVIPVMAGEDGNPVLVSRRLFGELVRLRGDEGARRVLRSGGYDVLRLPVADEGVRIDFDDPDAFRRE